MADSPVRSPRSRTAGPDRVTLAMLSLAAFLAALTFLATRIEGRGHAPVSRAQRIVLRRIYQRTVVERVFPASYGRSRGSVSQSTSSSSSAEPGAALAFAPVVTRTS